MKKQVCEKCNRIHTSDISIAVNRFNPLNKRYKGKFNNSILRETREEAEKDWCGYFQNRNNQ